MPQPLSALDHVVLGILAYVLTGVALVGYDMSAPPLERKQYVIRKNFKVAVVTWFVWPATVVFETLKERRVQRRYLRFLFGVLLLAGGMFLWAEVVYLASLWLIGVSGAAFVVTATTMLFACPIITGIAMPPHQQPGSR
jgi:hypothetical protein